MEAGARGHAARDRRREGHRLRDVIRAPFNDAIVDLVNRSTAGPLTPDRKNIEPLGRMLPLQEVDPCWET